MAMAGMRTTTLSGSDVRTEFKTKEGAYKNLKTYRYSKPRGVPLLGKELSKTKVTIASVKDMQGLTEWILFNSGRDFYCYPFSGTEKPPDLMYPVDKHSYRSSFPLCHDVNQCTRSVDSIDIVIGFNGGPLQRINPVSKSSLALYNNDRLMDSTDVTCVRWVPGSESQFVSSHMSGALLVWTIEEHYKSSNLPTFATHKKMKDTIIQVSKPKNKFPLLYRWTIGHGPIISFAFSPDTQHIAVASQDGFLRVYNFHKMEFYSRMRSYFGGFLCVCWSPDGKYVVGGSEDDLVSVWSFNDKRVVTRGEGHQSYINAVSFDPYALENNSTLPSFLRSESEVGGASLSLELKSQRSSRYIEEDQSYRVGSVGQDGIMCLWELSGDNLTIQRRGGRGQLHRGMSKQFSNSQHYEDIEMDHSRKDTEGLSEHKTIPDPPLEIPPSPVTNNKSESNTSKQTKKKRKGSERSVDVEMTSPIEPAGDLTMGGMGETSSISSDSSKEKKKNKHNQMNKIMKSNMVRKVKNLVSSGSSVPNRHISPFESCQSDDIAPKMSEINVIEPLVIKKIHNERLTDITFRDDCMLVATEDGYIQFWARPDYSAQPVNSGINSPKPGSSDGKQQHTTINSPKLNNDNLDGKQTSV